MKIQKIVLIFFSCLLIGLIVYQIRFGETIKNEKILVVGTSLDYPPYEFIDSNTQKPAGLDIDLVTEIAQRIDKDLVIEDKPFSSLIFGLLTNDVDMVASGISPTPRRAKLVSFSELYLTAMPFVVVTKSAQLQPINIDDLKDKIVGVNTGYVTDLYMTKEYPDITLVKLDSPADCFMALQIGTIDAFVTSPHTFKIFLENISNPQDFFMMQLPGTGEICAFAVAKNNEKLLVQINQVLEAMRVDGTLEKIKQKWGF
ncbi:amino acid ABC transporter substrate-binding protein [Candidatus Babeliales bacterium]|nr:amino acid ABC transporter substrate-binding protein [Candidatus Babeliales bacterium]